MNKSDLQELHYFAPIENLNSICERGILSHDCAAKIKHESVAMEVIQERRAMKVVPGGLKLHQYVNLYINARNKALSKLKFELKDRIADLSILRISLDVLDLPDVVIADRNASANWVRFASSPEGLKNIDKEKVFAEFWTHEDPIEQWEHGSVMCAEVLVPHRVVPTFIMGAYVSCEASTQKCRSNGVTIPIRVNKHLFFLE